MLAVNYVWLMFASLTAIGGLMYNIAVKISNPHINAFLFATVLASVALVAHMAVLFIYKSFYAQNAALQYDKTGLLMAVVAGLGVVIVDLAFFFAVKHGSVMASQLVWVIGGTLALTVVSALFFSEAMTPAKMTGIALGMAGLYLMIRE